MPVITAAKPTLGVPQRPLRRSGEDGILGGVCSGIAIRLGVRERTVRIAFSLSAILLGFGALVYAVLWLFVPRSGEATSIGQRLSKRRREAQALLVLLAIVLAVLFGLHSTALATFAGYSWTLLLSAVGAVAIWRGASTEERAHLEALVNAAPIVGSASARGKKALLVRVLFGVVLVVVGLKILGRIGGVWGAAVPALVGAMVLLVGVLVLLAPWWLQTVRDLSRERRERVRAEERAAMVTHIHDSVLQTLTLIERAAGNEADVMRLARAQERELRQWLFDPDSVGKSDHTTGSFSSSLAALERDIENDYGVKVELVVVGNCPMNDDLAALVAAGREAAVNAAKWSGAPTVSIFGEVGSSEVSLFVRDTGRGFDLERVADDRQGIALSIRQRVAAISGRVTIRTSHGAGTEVELVLPRPNV